MRVLALIPARGGSKRLPGKNIRLLGGKPLIVWSIEVVKEIPEICDILVSTDDPVIAAIGKEAGAFVPWLRPRELATDTASSVDVALHALDWYEAERGPVDGLLLLQPTSPFRKAETVRKGIELFGCDNKQQMVGVSPVTHLHPMWTLKIKGEFLEPFMKEHGFGIRSQELPAAYAVNGAFYLSSPAKLRLNRSFVDFGAVPLVIESPQEALDIDTAWDFKMAECVLASSCKG